MEELFLLGDRVAERVEACSNFGDVCDAAGFETQLNNGRAKGETRGEGSVVGDLQDIGLHLAEVCEQRGE